MSKVIPFFSARQINSVGDYRRFYHTKAYLAQRSAHFKGADANRRLMALCGYKRYEKFVRRRPVWDALAKPVPMVYLSAISAHLDVLTLTEAADMEEYRAALVLPLTGKYGIERLMPAVYRHVVLPDDTPEAEAVEIILNYSKKSGSECCINFSGLKTIFVYPSGAVQPLYFPPTIQIKGGFLLAGGDGREIGTCRLGR
jgi:hypothetical protein